MLEDGFTSDGSVVSAPPENDRIELLDEVLLASSEMLPNDHVELGIVSCNRRATGFDGGLKHDFEGYGGTSP